MKIIWHGHSCFTIETAQGSVVIDPFADNYVPGCGIIRPIADGVFCSHGHADHGCAEVVTLTGKAHTIGVETIPTWHDEAQGAKRGANLIHVFSAEGMRVVHLGDLGCGLDGAQTAALKHADVLMLPVGGFYTIGAEQARAIADQLAPRVVVPMHYKGEGFGYDVLTPVDDFLSLCSETVKILSGNEFEVTPGTPSQVIVPALPKNNDRGESNVPHR